MSGILHNINEVIMEFFEKFKSKLFEILYGKIKNQQDVEENVDVLQQRFVEKFNILRDMLKNKNETLSNESLEQYLRWTIYFDKDDFLPKTTIDLERLFGYLVELERTGKVSYKGESLFDDASKVLSTINESRTKCKDSKKIAKEDVENLIKSLEQGYGWIDSIKTFGKFPFEEQSIFDNFMTDLKDVTEEIKLICQKCSGENVEGKKFEKFEAMLNIIRNRVKIILKNLEDLYVQVRENGPFVQPISNALGRNLKSKSPVVATKNFEAIKILQYAFTIMDRGFEDCSNRYKISTVNIKEIVDKIKDIVNNTQIEQEITPPENKFKTSDMLKEIVEHLSYDEVVMNVLKTNERISNNDLKHVIEVVFNAVMLYMQKIDMAFVFDAKLKFINDNTTETAHIANYESLNNKSFYNSDLVVSLPKLWEYNEEGKPAVEIIFNVISIVIHECGHRLDFLHDSEAFTKRQESPIDKLKEIMGLKPNEEMNEHDMLFLSCLSPTFKETLMFGDEKQETNQDAKVDVSEVNRRLRYLTGCFNLVSYLNKDVEIFARKFSFDMLAGIIAGLKSVCKDQDIINNLSELDSNKFRVVDGGLICDYEADLSDAVYFMTGMKFDKEVEEKIEEVLKLNKKIIDEIQNVDNVDDLMRIVYASTRIYGKESEDLYGRGLRTIKAIVAQMTEDKFENLFVEAHRKNQNIIIGIMLDVKPNFYSKLTEDEWVELISKSGEMGGYFNCQFLNLETDDKQASKKMFERVLKRLCEANDFKGVVAYFKNSKISVDIIEYLTDWIKQIPAEKKETLEYEKLLKCLIMSSEFEDYELMSMGFNGSHCVDFLSNLKDEEFNYQKVFDKLHQTEIENISNITDVIPFGGDGVQTV